MKKTLEQGQESTTNSCSTLGFKPGTHWWAASTLKTAPSQLPLLFFTHVNMCNHWLFVLLSELKLHPQKSSSVFAKYKVGQWA